MIKRSRIAGLALSVTIGIIAANIPSASEGRRAQQVLPPGSDTKLSRLVNLIQGKAKGLESSGGMRDSFQKFTTAHNLAPASVRYSDFVLIRLLFEATRDAGLWGLHWSITDQPPNSDRVWQQWVQIKSVSPLRPTATAECDELSALYAFFVERENVKSVGLFWPAANHTVAVWVVHPSSGPVVRVVVPTSQIFLTEDDMFDTRKFDPWRQKTIYEYTRRDVPDAFEIPRPLFDFFVAQMDKYGGASDATLQRLRYIREGVFLRSWTPAEAARMALRGRSNVKSDRPEDLAAFQNFALDMGAEPPR